MGAKTVFDMFADGGCVGQNPSPDGCTWAYLWAAGDKVLQECSDYLLPGQSAGVPAVLTNNFAELFAALVGLEAIVLQRQTSSRWEWSGRLFTDSQITLYRVCREKSKFNGIPDEIVARLRRAQAALGKIEGVLLSGHPNKEQLASGLGKRGLPCHKHNVRCDRLCQLKADQCRFDTKGVRA